MVVLQQEPRAEFSIEELPEGVRFHVRPGRAPFTVVWNYVYPTFLAYLLSGSAGDGFSWGRLLLVAGGGLAAGTWLNRPRVITTTFGRDGVRVTGALGSGAHSPRWTPLETIAELRWQPSVAGDGDSPGRPSGLYARCGLLPRCVVPFVDEGQAQRAILAIEQRFSWIDRTPGSPNSLLFAEDLVRLNLER